jgi:acyl phosphate:glycerol-3-phosphate acyltransferase
VTSSPWLVAVAGAAGYAVGSLSPATFIARRAGLDLRSVGSGNPGATNVGRALGPRVGAMVALLDVVKGALPAAGFGVLDASVGLVAGVAAVLGHVSSPLLRGRGGKGVATAFGAVVGSHPLWAPVALAAWLLGVLTTRVVAVASVVAATSIVVVAVVVHVDRASIAWACAIAAIVAARHAGNVRRWWRRRRTGS